MPARPPPALIDLAATDREVWNRFLWKGLQGLLLDNQGTPLRLATRTFRQNVGDYRRQNIINALSVIFIVPNSLAQNYALSVQSGLVYAFKTPTNIFNAGVSHALCQRWLEIPIKSGNG